MRPSERRRFIALAKRLSKKARQLTEWNKKNSHRCGHSNTPDALGDEGWHQLFENSGSSHALDYAASSILELLKRLETK